MKLTRTSARTSCCPHQTAVTSSVTWFPFRPWTHHRLAWARGRLSLESSSNPLQMWGEHPIIPSLGPQEPDAGLKGGLVTLLTSCEQSRGSTGPAAVAAGHQWRAGGGPRTSRGPGRRRWWWRSGSCMDTRTNASTQSSTRTGVAAARLCNYWPLRRRTLPPSGDVASSLLPAFTPTLVYTLFLFLFESLSTSASIWSIIYKPN